MRKIIIWIKRCKILLWARKQIDFFCQYDINGRRYVSLLKPNVSRMIFLQQNEIQIIHPFFLLRHNLLTSCTILNEISCTQFPYLIQLTPSPLFTSNLFLTKLSHISITYLKVTYLQPLTNIIGKTIHNTNIMGRRAAILFINIRSVGHRCSLTTR